jgi:hypothetical protein
VKRSPLPRRRWGEYVNRRLDAIASGVGAADWEEETGGPYPTPERVQQAREVTERYFRPTTPTPSVVPGDEGDVEFVWHKNGIDVWVIVGEHGTEVQVYRRGDREWEIAHCPIIEEAADEWEWTLNQLEMENR